MRRAASLLLAAAATALAYDKWRDNAEALTLYDLRNEYGNIFKHGNRNAASHRWATFLLDRAAHPGDYKRYRLRLPLVGGGGATRSGFMYYCCWPCVCDTQDFIRADTKTITTKTETRVAHFAVIGNPCAYPEKLDEPFVQPFDGRSTTLRRDAAEVRCGADGSLEGATLSDHGHVIIGLFFDAPDDAVDAGDAQPGRVRQLGAVSFQDETDFAPSCGDRAAHGYNSGMGEIFRRVAAINPIDAQCPERRRPGKRVLDALGAVLGASNVFDLGENPHPERILASDDLVAAAQKPPGLRIVVCGGDGTMTWIMAAIDLVKERRSLGDAHRFYVAMMPLGTGNDLARTFGWGGKFRSACLRPAWVDGEKGETRAADRWLVSVMPSAEGQTSEKLLDVPEVFSVHEFEATAEAGAPKSRHTTLKEGRHHSVRLTARRRERGRGAGARRRALEVVVADDVFSMGATLVATNGLGGRAKRLIRAKELRITTRERVFMQIDGEPWLQPPATVHLKCFGQSTVLKRAN
ncbi:hypothetical protein JL720_16374 [Aureococcus anophagefferens]|nr:hypothetical protein JL720_16374 [Aureococcus anophagefferens]